LKEFARFELSGVVERLRAFAAGAGLDGETTTYVLADQELIPRHLLAADGFRVMRIIERYGRLITVDLPFVAERILVGANVRVLGLPAMPGLTAKVRMLRRRYVGRSFFRDFVARRVLEALIPGDEWSVPRLHKRDKRGTWLIEDHVAGKQLTASDLLHFIERHGPSLYGITARLKPAIRSPHHAWLLSEIGRILGRLAPGLARVADGARWPVGLCHGDLNNHNGLKDADDRYWLIDWESAGIRPIVLDLAQVYLANPAIKPAALNVLRSLDPNGDAMDPLQQLAIGAAFEMEKRSQWRIRNIERNARRMNQKPSEAAAEFDRNLARMRAAIIALTD
jgi:hypothetical protein